MARHNLGADVAAVPGRRPASGQPRHDRGLLDPARRGRRRRRFDPQGLPAAVGRARRGLPGPGHRGEVRTRYRLRRRFAGSGFDGEVEVASAGGAVREACLWSPGTGGSRGAAAGPACWIAVRPEMSADRRRAPMTAGPAERDAGSSTPTVRWCGRVWYASTGARHGLWQLDPDIAYLTGDRFASGGPWLRGDRPASAAGKGSAPSAFGAGLRCPGDPGTRGGRRPGCTAAAAAAGGKRLTVGGDHADGYRSGLPRRGLRLPSFDRPACPAGPVGCTAMRILSLAVTVVAGAVLAAPPVTAATGGLRRIRRHRDGRELPRPWPTIRAYTMDMTFPLGYPDERAIVDYLQTDPGWFRQRRQHPGCAQPALSRWMSRLESLTLGADPQRRPQAVPGRR